ncbi:GDSL-type esterase/lipase family protein [Dyadobacter diqingensis]|uniref:GDSL-type esterase/lipase family protein n=1 Tax=Dyadobacter diqingensis TaxID=2938121 RepID=UPI0020C52B94|nr:GDSL-type esterase/lipase family protein [Dyadobacter diqingensis]
MFWYEEEVVRVGKELSRLDYLPETVFYGSSTFTLWETLYTDFEALKPVNLGFGGSTLAACAWFFDRVLAPVTSAKSIIIYAGDNDLGDGRQPEEVCLFYRQLISQIRNRFGNIPCSFVSIKPSLQRWEIIEQIKSANRLILAEVEKDEFQHYIDIFPETLNEFGYPQKAFFEADGLHLSNEGYAVWKEVISKQISLIN